jgi:serine/threonine-protein kinase
MAKLGKFEIQEQLGHGGMGVVYRAWDSKMERWVALKTIAQDKAARSEFIKRFRREALSAGRLDHPNIVTIYEFDEQEDVCYIAMQFLEGQDLESLLSSPRWDQEFSIFRKLEVLIQICQGLSYAHRNGVIHRDVKPANVMILPDGTPKLVDFGIARIGEQTSGTQNLMLGTAPYMAPEQVEGKRIDERVDVFAVGVVGYRMFTGHFPFLGPNLSSILYKIVHDPPPPLSTFLTDYPPDLESVLFRALAKDRDQRYPTMEEMAFDLQTLLSSLNTSLVSSYVEEARRLILLQDYSRAKELLRKVLELEPGQPAATQMWQQVQKLLQQEYAKRKVQTLLKEGTEAYERQDWLHALECFDQGLQLDGTHEMLRTYRDLTLREQEKIEAVSQNLKSARESLQRRDWMAARQALHQVLEMHPENTEAQTLLSQADAELADIEKRRNAQQYLERAQQALAAGRFGEALSLLDKAQALDPDNGDINRLRNVALAEQAETEQHKLRAETIAAVQAALGKGDFAAALQQAEVGLRAFPSDPALQQLQTRANQGLESVRRKKQLAEQAELAHTLVEKGDLAGAKKILAVLRERDSLDTRVQSLSVAVAKLDERLERECRRDAELDRARVLMRENRLDEARRVLLEVRNQFGRSAPVQELLTLLEKESKRRQQESELQQILDSAAALADKDDYKKALEVLRKAPRRYQAQVSEELNRLGRLAREADERRGYMERVRGLIADKQWPDALRALGEAPESYRSTASYKELWQAATSGVGGGTAAQDEIPTGVIRPEEAPRRVTAMPARLPTAVPVTAPPVAAEPSRASRFSLFAAALASGVSRLAKVRLRGIPLAYLLGAVLILAVGVAVVLRLPARRPPAPPVPLGTVRLDILPWAELKEIRNEATGKSQPGTGHTPLNMSLPPGDYRLTLVHPRFGQLVAYPVHVESGAVVDIRQSFPKFDPDQVWKSYE